MITIIIFLAILLFVVLPLSIVIVPQQSVKIVQRFGKFKKMAMPGLNFRIPVIDQVAGELDLRVRQMLLEPETKTKDNVFVVVRVAVQNRVIDGKLYEAFYALKSAGAQIESYVADVVRAEVPKMKLDEVFENKEALAKSIGTYLEKAMDDFGYAIVQTLVTDVEPDKSVKAAMNEMNATERLKTAALNKAEAEKITIVKKAEAEAESKKLQGQGIADQRKAIVKGLEESIGAFTKATSVKPGEAMSLVMLAQYFDTLKSLGEGGKANTIFVPHSPGGLEAVAEQIRNAVVAANKA